MKNENSAESENPKPEILGANLLQVGEAGASSLVGGIVEKGLTDIPQPRALGTTSAPRPTVLPFPVARHRFHGPHWDSWSRRVESVREMRFSLDGNIVRGDFAYASDTGNPSSESGYSAHNASERDFLRTEGDPGASGYTIKEAVALTRSVVPRQRTLALHLIAAVLDKAICSIRQSQADSASSNLVDAQGPVDWEAIWAFALGPEPELALSLRTSLDDNHNSVVLACAKAIQSVLTEPSNILRLGEDMEGDKAEGEHTIQDDVILAGQDLAAGLVRMEILPRICCLLETDPAAPLEECLISILIAIARHSPTCAAAIVDSGGLVQTVVNRFASKEQLEINLCKIKSVTLLKVLARHNKNCLAFMNSGIFGKVTWNLHRNPISLDKWVKSGREACKLSSALLVEWLRLWKVFIHNGYCISYFSKMYSSLLVWLSVPNIEHLIDNDVIREYCAITKEIYLLLDVLAGKLPNFYSSINERKEDASQDEDALLWNQLGSIIDLAIEWIKVKSIPIVSALFDCQNKDNEHRILKDSEIDSLLWVISSVLNLLSTLLKAVIPEDIMNLPNGHLPWLPEFVTQTGLEIIENGYLQDAICNDQPSENGSVVRYLCHLRTGNGRELAMSSTCCLQGLVQVVGSVDKLIQHTNLHIHRVPFLFKKREDKVLANGILKSCVDEVRYLLTTSVKLITNEWQQMQPVEIFGRGGSAPGVGVGWGASDGGYFSLNTMLAQQDARLLVYLLEIFEIPDTKDPLEPGLMDYLMQILNCALTACLVVGPGNSPIIDKLLKFIFQVPVMKYLDLRIRQFLSSRQGYSPFSVKKYEDKEYLVFANLLATHFRNRWLSVKKKKQKSTDEINRASHKSTKKGTQSLETIHEDDTSPSSSVGEELSSSSLEWAYPRLPLPAHWFLSAISNFSIVKNASHEETYTEVPSDFLEVAKSGLFFLLGVEAISASLSSELPSPVKSVPVVWKLHAMSVVLLSGMGVLEDEKSRGVYENLQNVYGKFIDEKELSKSQGVGRLRFESEIHDNYSTFIETLVGQFAAESDGNVLFGRQVAIYLHRSVEASVRLTTWNVLSNATALELLPPLDKCLTKAEGYLEPIEDDERILDAYAKSWLSGALDEAAKRSSVTFSLVLHHLSSFFFGDVTADLLSLRQRLASSLLGDYSSKPQHEEMVLKLVCYKRSDWNLETVSERKTSLPLCEIEKRLQLLKDICGRHATAVEKLELSIRKRVQ